MQPPFRSKQEVIINAPLEAVWSFSMDLTRIPEFHPRVVKVDLLSGKTFREPVASYQCHLSGALGDVEVIIRTRAYELYEERGRQDGHDLDDWLQAGEELLQKKAHNIAAYLSRRSTRNLSPALGAAYTDTYVLGALFAIAQVSYFSKQWNIIASHIVD